MTRRSLFILYFLLSLLPLFLLSCPGTGSTGSPSIPDSSTTNSITGTKEIELNLIYDTSINTNTQKSNIYVIWLENDQGKKQHLFICNRLLNAKDNGDYITNYTRVLPFWHLNRYSSENEWLDDRSDIDTVSGPTIAQSGFKFPDDFSNLNDAVDQVPSVISSELGDTFTLYIEMDQSCQFNDWFNVADPGTVSYSAYDEPAVLYAVEIDLTSSVTDYPLVAIGWTPHIDFSSFYLNGDTVSSTLSSGIFNDDMRYITHSKVSSVFDAEYLPNSSTSLITSITASISDAP